MLNKSFQNTKKNNLKMVNQNKNTGNPHTNETRDLFNSKVSRLSMLGSSKKVAWDKARRNRSI